jgi:Pectate lyase superfamily protein
LRLSPASAGSSNQEPEIVRPAEKMFRPSGQGSVVRTIEAKLDDRVSVRDFGAIGDGLSDDTAAFQLALRHVESLPRGGEIFVPAGVYRASLDLSRRTADFTKRVTITGAGRGATQVWPVDTGAIMVNMVGRNLCTLRDLTIHAGDQYEAQVGVLLARSVGSDNCNSNNFTNVEVVGNFSRSAVISIAAENGSWQNCLFRNNNPKADHTAFITGNTPDLPVTTVTGAGQDLTKNANTAVRLVACDFYAPYPAAVPVVVSRAASYSFLNCNWGCPGSEAMIRFCDPEDGIISGNLKLFGSHYEGGRGAGSVIFQVQTRGATALRGLTDLGSVIVGDRGMAYLDYNREVSGGVSLLSLEGCNLQPGRSLGTVEGLDLHADIVDASTLDWSNLAGMGAVRVYGGILRSSVRGGTVHAVAASDTPLDFSAAAEPTSGVYPKGAFVRHREPEIGGPLGWVALHGGSMDTDPITATASADRTNRLRMSGGHVIYEGARLWIEQFGYAMVRKVVGDTLYLNVDVPMRKSGIPVHYSGQVEARFATAGVVGTSPAMAQLNSTATDLTGIVADFNSLLAGLRAAGVLRS